MENADHDRIPEMALAWHQAGRGAVLATVVETWGSAPRRAGSQLAVSGDGLIMGSVSGGCVEGAVIEAAGVALAKGRSEVLRFGVSDADAFAVGLACGGTIRVLVEPVCPTGLSEPMLKAIVAARGEKRGIVYRVDLANWGRSLAETDEALRLDRAFVAADGCFVLPYNPPLRLVIVGAVHIAQALVAMARLCGWDPVIIDPRTSFAAAERFPGEVVLDDWPDAALEALAPDGRTAIVTLTHDPKLDDPAIRAALASNCFYLGCLGSSRTHAKRLERLRTAGLSEADLGRIHAPVGLDLGASNPAEIALSVMAQITQMLRSGR